MKKTIAKPNDGLPVELRMTKEEKRKKIRNDEYDKLVSRIEQIKSFKIWDKLNDENDKLVTRLNRLEPVKIKIAIDRPPRKFWLLKYAFVDEPRDEINLPKYAFQYDIFDEEIERMAQNECYVNFDQLLVKEFLRFKEKEDKIFLELEEDPETGHYFFGQNNLPKYESGWKPEFADLMNAELDYYNDGPIPHIKLDPPPRKRKKFRKIRKRAH